MNIGEAAGAAGVSAKTIRYYESIGLIRTPDRTENGYRVYDHRDVQTLRFVQRARKLGFSVRQVRDLLALWMDRERSSADVKSVARAQLAEIDRRMSQLAAMRDTLTHLMERCHGDARPDCPILADLAGDEEAVKPAPDST